MLHAGDHAEPQKHSLLKTLFEILVFIVLVIAATIFSHEFVAEAYGIPSGSMENTIMTGDRVATEQVSYYFRDIEPGDIVTFEDSRNPNRILVKRCIATEGQSVDLREGQVYIDDVALSEPYTEGKPTEPLPNTLVDITYPYTVPEDHLWVMGDNRTNSLDSRYFGPIEVEAVQERAFAIIWPLDHATVLG